MKIKGMAVLIVFLAVSMHSCVHNSKKHLISVPENVPVKILHQDSQTGIIIQYSIEKVEVNNGKVVIHLLEPGKLHSISKDTANLYFKVEMRNPTGENIGIYTVINKGKRRTVQMNISGNIPDSIFFVNAPIDKPAKKTRMKVVLKLYGKETPILETKELVYLINK